MDIIILQKYRECWETSIPPCTFWICLSYLSLYFLLCSIMPGTKQATEYILIHKEMIKLQLYRHIKKCKVSIEDKDQMGDERNWMWTNPGLSTNSSVLKANRWTYSHWNIVHLYNSLANLLCHLSSSLNNLEFKSLQGVALKFNFLVNGHGALNSVSKRTNKQNSADFLRIAIHLSPQLPWQSLITDIIIPRRWFKEILVPR